ncbi:LamG-like jellyroll fold domain-containing protein [Phaeobacter sp. 22II1-1F12B]|uniref:LamG-like jellyroll fold domain-containing protein n=1 Tax=Phaeobacter sp. 22II1-1F12B TaxID=1317111 RepID=UPI000B527E68|nr:LamG-like jellyroll fold domain-containing protein [Phaeobacter sp. 22II1-1F12B]OWU80426.1 hypothetical protein ATO1_08725 [Phaeobacter sp. 22II1-1F12B]
MAYSVPSTTSNMNLPIPTALITQIRAAADLHFALRVTEAEATLDGAAISALIDATGTYAVAQTVASEKPQFDASHILSRYAAATFDGGDALLFDVAPDFSEAFTLIAIAKPDASLSGYERVFGNRTSATVTTNLRFGDTGIAFWNHGTGSLSQSAKMDGWNVIVAAYDGATTLKLRVNGKTMTTAATDGAASTGLPAVGAGNGSGLEPFGGALKLLDMHEADLFASDSGLALIELYERLAANTYGVVVE